MPDSRPPIADVICVGTELLLGDVVNSNAAWLGEQLADNGIQCFYHTAVGDNPTRIGHVIDHALNRAEQPADILIFTGGLGPTDDDLTVATIVEHFGQTPTMVSDPASEEAIKAFFIARNMTHSRNNLKQALRPSDGIALANHVGTAPGLVWDISPHVGRPAIVLCFPGVPKELFALWPQGLSELRQWLGHHPFTTPHLARTFLHFFGIGESKIAELLADVMADANPTVAPYVGKSSVRIRLAAMANSEGEANELLAPVKTTILERLGDYYIGEGDTIHIEERVGQTLVAHQASVAVAESCTGGLVSSRLTDVPGSSTYTTLNVTTYSNDAKTEQLGVNPDLIGSHGAVSTHVAAAMAEGIRAKANSTYGLALTGIAGPDGGTADKPVGLVYIGVATPNGTTVTKQLVNSRLSRQDIKFWFSEYALHALYKALQA